jgi:hypothetical protein
MREYYNTSGCDLKGYQEEKIKEKPPSEDGGSQCGD